MLGVPFDSEETASKFKISAKSLNIEPLSIQEVKADESSGNY